VAGAFPTASTPTGSTSPIPSPPPGVGTFPSITFAKEFVKVRFLEPNVAQGINQRWLGMPRGVYLGFIPSVTPGSKLLTLEVDPGNSFSLLKVPSSEETMAVDIFTADPVILDFSAHTVWPVYVLATAQYITGRPTQGKIFTRAATANSINEVVICKIDKTGDDLVVETTLPTSNQPPVAFKTQPYGYMPENAIDDLATTNATVVEVIAARTSVFTGGHGDLKTRLDADMIGTEIADRLGLRPVHLISNAHPDKSGTTANVSGSFTETGRVFGPTLTIEANANETTEGAITDGSRNICFVIDGTTGQRITDANSGEPVYGITSFAEADMGVGKEVHFVNASTSVNGDGTNPFVAPLEAGDIVEGPDGLFYELLSIADPDNAVLGAAYQGVDGFVSNTDFRRWTLFFFTASGGPFNISVPTSIQFIFPCFFRVDRAIFDGYLLIKKDGERPQLPLATAATAGRSTLAVDGGLIGSVRTVKDSSLTVKLNAHTFNFVNNGASNPFPGSGVAHVSVPGEPGPVGPGANQGPPGPSGAASFGYSNNNKFEPSVNSSTTVATSPFDAIVSFTQNWTVATPALAPMVPRTYAHVNGGWSFIDGPSNNGWERLHIDELTDVSADETRITMRIQIDPFTSNTVVAGFMGASQ
jgi:hypothetical protein